MHELGFHLMFRLEDDRVIAPSAAKRRTLARPVYRVCEDCQLLCFGAADTHLHVEVTDPPERLGRLTQRLTESLRRSLRIPVRFARPHIKPLRDQHHLVNTFHYGLNQRNRHGVRSDPFLDASSLPELLGMRNFPTDSLRRVREFLPRLTRDDLLPHLWPPQLPDRPRPPADLLPSVQLIDACDAAAGAFGLGSLAGSSNEALAASATLAQLAAGQLSVREQRAQLGCSKTRHWRLKKRNVTPAQAYALGLQLSLRAWLWQAHPDLLSAGPLL